MDINVYVDAAIQKIQNSNHYSELTEKELRYVIESYIKDKYNDEVALFNLQMDMEQARGKIADIEKFKEKVEEIKRKMLKLTQELSKVTK